MDARVSRQAFLLGCNSHSLRHCERDVDTLARVLAAHCSWSVESCTPTNIAASPDQGAPFDIVIRRLRTFLKRCARGDTAAFYFSGHSLCRRGVFSLVVGADINDTDNLLDIQVIVSAFKQSVGLAEVLLILDCCDAGEAAEADGFWQDHSRNLGPHLGRYSPQRGGARVGWCHPRRAVHVRDPPRSHDRGPKSRRWGMPEDQRRPRLRKPVCSGLPIP